MKNIGTFKNHVSTIICVSVVFVMVLAIGVNNAYATDIPCIPVAPSKSCIIYDYNSTQPYVSTWYFIGHGAVINITDANAVKFNHNTITAHIAVVGASDNFDFTLTRINDPLNPNTYESNWINFTSGQTSASNLQLHVSPTNTVTVTYPHATNDGGRPPPHADVATIYSSTEGTIPVAPAWDAKENKANDLFPPGDPLKCPDADNDAICDPWEDQVAHPGTLSIPYTDSVTHVSTVYTLTCNPQATYDTDPTGATVCPSTTQKDIYVQIDWFKRHYPDPRAIANVTRAFLNAGVSLHIQLGNETPHYSDLTSPPASGANNFNPQDFDKIKRYWFGTASERSCPGQTWGSDACNNEIAANLTAKRQVFHYVLFAHSRSDQPYSSGASEQIGNDAGVYLGHFGAAVGTFDQQQGTLMHELGHNLGLWHGGGTPPDNTNPEYDNCKPNYLSVMNYVRQFKESFPINRALNYSSGWFSPISKLNIDECQGMPVNPNMVLPTATMQESVKPTLSYNTISNIYTLTGYAVITPLLPSSFVDWNADTNQQGTTCGTVNSTWNINYFYPNISVCNPPSPAVGASTTYLKDHDDWSTLNFNLRYNSNFNDGASAATGGPNVNNNQSANSEITLTDLTGMRLLHMEQVNHDLGDLFFNNPQIRQGFIQAYASIKDYQLYPAIADLERIRDNPSLTQVKAAYPSVVGMIDSLNLATSPPSGGGDDPNRKSPPPSCSDTWKQIPILRQFELVKSYSSQTIMSTGAQKSMILLNSHGCAVPPEPKCPTSYSTIYHTGNVATSLPSKVCLKPTSVSLFVQRVTLPNSIWTITVPTDLSIYISNPTAGSTENTSTFLITGTAAGTNLASVSVTINGSSVAVTGTTSWSASSGSLHDGHYTILATATDNAGKSESSANYIMVNTSNPGFRGTGSNNYAAANTNNATVIHP